MPMSPDTTDITDRKHQQLANYKEMKMTRLTLPSIRRNGGAFPRPGRRHPGVSRAVAIAALATAAATLAACGSSSSASTTSSTAAPHGTGATGGGGGRQFPGASGTIAAVNGTSLEVQNPTTGQTTVTYTTATTFEQTVAASAADVTAGVCVSAVGKPTSTSSSTQRFGLPVTATTVVVSQPTSGSCSGTGGFGRGGSGAPGTGAPGAGPPGGPSGEQPGRSGGFPGRAGGQFAAASGLVTAVNGSQATVSETSRTTNQATSVAVTLTSSTTYTQRTAASASDLAVGKCAQAVGTADTTGAVTARSITVSTPGANGCSGRFGAGRFGGGGGPGGGTGSAGA